MPPEALRINHGYGTASTDILRFLTVLLRSIVISHEAGGLTKLVFILDYSVFFCFFSDRFYFLFMLGV